MALPLLAVVLALGWVGYKIASSRPGVLPSSHFRQLDANSDGAVAFDEWRSYYATRTGWDAYEWDFRFMDCNEDRRLTWREYKAWTFQRRACGKDMNLADRPRSPGSVSSCESDPANRLQTCYVTDSSGAIDAPPPAGPMKELEIPR